jgi:hypothetical protein
MVVLIPYSQQDACQEAAELYENVAEEFARYEISV